MTHTVTFEPWGSVVEVEPGSTLLDAARTAGVPMGAVCGGRGTCGKCRVRILEGSPAAAAPAEAAVLPPGAAERGERLACRTVVTGPLAAEAIVLHPAGKTAAPPLPSSFTPDPPVQRCAVRVPPPTLDRPVDDAESLLQALGEAAHSIDHGILGGLPGTLRASGWNVTASIRGGEAIAVRATAGARPPLGLAVDLGTTTIAASLYGLDDAALLGSWSAADPLSVHGADIVTRMTWALAAPGNCGRLQSILARSLTEIAQRAAAERGADTGDIEEMVVVCNSGMHHLLLGLPGRSLMNAPFVPVVRAPLSLKARDLGIIIAPGAFVHLPPLVGGFIGSDLLAVALAERPDQAAGVRVALDVGTNTEILLSVDGALTACSTASGPALEGAALRFGSMAVQGAIDSVRSAEGSSRLQWSTIGGRPASGICGSGIIDLLARLLETGTVDARGRLQADAPGVLVDPGGERRYVLAHAEETSIGQDISVTQPEIRQLQLAKGAIRAGIDSLLSRRGVEPGSVDEILVAGNFGAHIDPAAALAIGLLPPVPAARVRRVGNAAQTGAAMMLLSVDERRAAAGLARAIVHVELAREPGFTRRFALAQWFAEKRQ
jgi:uncharacterized 2Fe-2S/4Fe-4S cluster protein (DUF4445 family)